MKNPVKTHARDYLLEFLDKNNPNWLVALIRKTIELNSKITDEDKDNIFKLLLRENDLSLADVTTSINNQEEPFESQEDFTNGYDPSTDGMDSFPNINSLKINRIEHVSGVNALLNDQSIPFASNFTMIYGLNGTGKSGYFRIINELAGGEQEKEIKDDINNPADGFEVKMDYEINGQARPKYTWIDKSNRGIFPFTKIRVFDTEYLPIFLQERDSSVNIEPLGLHLFQSITDVIDEYKATLTRLKERESQQLPDLRPLINSIKTRGVKNVLENTSITPEQMVSLKSWLDFPGENVIKLKEHKQNKKKLEQQNIRDSKKVMENEKGEIERLIVFMRETNNALGGITCEASKSIDAYISKKKIRDNRKKEFDVLKKIPAQNSEEWEEFIKSAKKYGAEIDPDIFNVKNLCIYCHQPLKGEAIKLVQAYSQYLGDNSQNEYMKAERSIEELKNKVLHINTKMFCSGIMNGILDKTNYKGNLLRKHFEHIVEAANGQKDALIKALTHKENIAATFSLPLLGVIEALGDMAQALKDNIARLNVTDQEKVKQIEKLTSKINKLEDWLLMSQWKESILKHFSIYELLKRIDDVNRSINTRVISNLSVSAHDALLTEKLRRMFETELGLLDKDIHVNLQKVSASKGKVHTRLEILGNDVSSILSEGEQKAVGLALFFAEVENRDDFCPVVFDDPVNSLDHEISNNVAERIILLSQRRQTIVFTHNLPFASQLARHGNKLNILLMTHVIDRLGSQIGHINENDSPRMATLVKLKEAYSKAIINYETMKYIDQQKALEAAFVNLRRSCECLIEEVLFNNTIQRYDNHIRVQNLEEVVFDKDLAMQIVVLHGEMSEEALHNKSDESGQIPVTLETFNGFKKRFEDLHANILKKRKELIKSRGEMKKMAKKDPTKNW